tara:strand:+ start:383 stop:571 length:189 start_codon:yes stop_codon:yes gene_type:complete
MKQTNYTQKELQIIEGFFTDDEWNAIEYALEDYQDYGDNEAKLASQIEDKIYSLYNTYREVS